MAILDINTRMVYWKLYLYNMDITNIIGKYLLSFKIKTSILPLASKKQKEQHSANEAELEIYSRNYIESWFIEGAPVKIECGYEKTALTTVFVGKIIKLPNGSAKDMLSYTVNAFSDDILLAVEQKSRTFSSPIKYSIVDTVLSSYPQIEKIIDIDDWTQFTTNNIPIQKMESDMAFLTRIAGNWKCKMWFAVPNILYFVDDSKVHSYQEKNPYKLGYRTDHTKCNVETIKWTHTPSRAALTTPSGIVNLNEFGKIKTEEDIKVVAPDGPGGEWFTWKLRPEYAKEAKMDYSKYYTYMIGVARATYDYTAYEALKKYFIRVDDNGKNSSDVPASESSGFTIEIELNKGDPTLFAPFTAMLYAGSLNPKADTSHLPDFLFRYGWSNMNIEVSELKVNEHTLTFSDGRLKSDLKCTQQIWSN